MAAVVAVVVLPPLLLLVPAVENRQLSWHRRLAAVAAVLATALLTRQRV
jgi:hypothetical protein